MKSGLQSQIRSIINQNNVPFLSSVDKQGTMYIALGYLGMARKLEVGLVAFDQADMDSCM